MAEGKKEKSLKELTPEERKTQIEASKKEAKNIQELHLGILNKVYSLYGLNSLGSGIYGMEGMKSKQMNYSNIMTSSNVNDLRKEIYENKINYLNNLGVYESPSISDSELITEAIKLGRAALREGSPKNLGKLLSEKNKDFSQNEALIKKAEEIENKSLEYLVETGEEYKPNKEESKVFSDYMAYKQILSQMYEKSSAIELLQKNKFSEFEPYLKQLNEEYSSKPKEEVKKDKPEVEKPKSEKPKN